MAYNVKKVTFRDGIVDTYIYKKGIETGRHKEKWWLENRKLCGLKKNRNKEDDRRRSASRTKQKIYMLARNQKWDWFVTLTLDPQKIDRFDYDLTVKKLSKWLNNLRRLSPDMFYLFVPEQHKDGAYHFHGLMGNVEGLKFQDSGHKDKKGRIIYNLSNYKYGWSTATPVTNNDSVIHYISKYITKELIKNTLGRKHYWASRNLELPYVDYGFEDEAGKCLLWQHLEEGCVYFKESNNLWNGVQYYKNQPKTSSI